MHEEHNPPAPAPTPESDHSESPVAPASLGAEGATPEGEPRKRRRRRGGRRRRKGAGQPGDPAAGAPVGAPGAEGVESDDAGDDEGDESQEGEAADTSDAGSREGESSGAPATGEPGEGGKRRRRRRRGRGGRGGQAGPDGAPAGEGAPAPLAPNRAPKQAPRHDRPPHPRHHDEDADAPPAPRPPRQKPAMETGSKDWEEIFQHKTFADLGLRNSVLKGIEAAGFINPTKIQAEMIPPVIAGRDVLGQSRTGTGKTAAFGLPLYNNALRDIPFQSLILAPTRELAIQIAAELTELGKFTPVRISAVYGGQSVGTQARHLERGPEIIVATPGRLMDMVERRHVHLNNVRFAVLDEVDRMLDIGFRDDIKKILGSIKQAHQTIFVSATISEEIDKLARTFMKDPVKLVTTGGSLTVSLVEQHYIAVQPWDKRQMLLHVLTHEEPELTVVFCRMKRTVDELAKYLSAKGIDAHPMHGDMYQGKRNSVMKRLRDGTLGVVVASDLAARGLDVDGISHVVNYDLPDDPEVYIHRIGRTARAGRRGVAWSLVTPDQGPLLTAIEMLANIHIPEQKYPDFKPGPLPQHIQAERERTQQRADTLRSVSRVGPPALPVNNAAPARSDAASPAAAQQVTVTVDPSKFPGGLVPTKLPPKRMGGRIKSVRAFKQAQAQTGNPAAPGPAPAAEPGSQG